MLAITAPASLYQPANLKLEQMFNSSGKSNQPSPPNSPSTSTNNDRKRAAEGPSLTTNSQGNDRPNKRPFSPSAAQRDNDFSQHALQWRSNLMSASLLGTSHDIQRLSDYHSTLLASSLANRHAELASRQLLSRYLAAPQLRISSLSALASSPTLGLQSFPSLSSRTSQVGSGISSGAPGASQSLAALLSLPHNDSLNVMAGRFPAVSLGQRTAADAGSFRQACSRANPQEHREETKQPERGSLRQDRLAEQGERDGSTALGIDEDPNWLSDFHVFVRKNLVELCWATSEDVALRSSSNRVSSEQVGIRCKCCSHLNPSARAQRSSAFPSSIAQIYQSFTMMLRAHFGSCTEVPTHLKEKFVQLKSKTTQGATDSKQYWIYSARKLGMVDSEEGIVMTKKTTAAASSIPPFGSNSEEPVEPPIPLVGPNDRSLASDFLYTLMLQGRRIKLQANEKRGNKKSLQLRLPGFGCRYCCQVGRMGQCRIFPARRRTLPVKIYDLYEHLMRCSACPKETKDLLELLHEHEDYQAKTPGHKEFLDLVWSRLVDSA